jgi:hypothetical protein
MSGLSGKCREKFNKWRNLNTGLPARPSERINPGGPPPEL